MADPKGTMTDWKNQDISWNGNWKYGASINQSDWTAEFRIPFSELGINPIAEKQTLRSAYQEVFLTENHPTGRGNAACQARILHLCIYGRWPEPVPGKNILYIQSGKHIKRGS